MSAALGCFRLLVGFAALAALAACASTDDGSRSSKTSVAKTGTPYGPPSPHRKVGNPYKVAGIWYYPQEQPGYSKVGIASWYGPKFHGRKTANGEIFDMNRLTAAHPTLPLPSVVRVTNVENGRSIDLRLNDRGPFAHGRVIDLSRAAAEQLGYREKGLAKVRVEYLAPASLQNAVLALGEPEAYARGRVASVSTAMKPPADPQYDTVRTRIATGPEITVARPLASAKDMNTAHMTDARASVMKAEEMIVEAPASIQGATAPVTAPTPKRKPVPATPAATAMAAPPQSAPVKTMPLTSSGIYLVQVAAFSSRENADRTINQFSNAAPVRTVRESKSDGSWLYKVRLGPYQSEPEAENAKLAAISAGFSDARIVRY